MLLTSCTLAAIACNELPKLQVLEVPDATNDSACNALALMYSASPHGPRAVDVLRGTSASADRAGRIVKAAAADQCRLSRSERSGDFAPRSSEPS